MPTNRPFLHKTLNTKVRTTQRHVQNLLQKLQNDGLVNVDSDHVEIENIQRLKMAVHAINLGADPERVSTFLHWREFEEIAAYALEQNGYVVTKNLRFNHEGRKWEIDVVGCRKPLVACVDCKHWHHGMHVSRLERVAKEQMERTKALTDTVPNPKIKLQCTSWDEAKFIPAVLSLLEDERKFFDNIPVVPVVKLQDFLTQLPVHTNTLQHFTKSFVDNRLFAF